jgi:PHD/YefM family antitoxin component YafN of YafNO toxin-antitoxin module
MEIIAESPKHETTFITISKDEYESMKSTIEILGDKELMAQLRESEKAIKKGKVRRWDEFVKKRGII